MIMSTRKTDRLRVLLADDSPDNRLLIRAFLKNSPFEIDDAADGAIAVEKVKSGKYHVVLMDMQMPIMDGLRSDPRYSTKWSLHAACNQLASLLSPPRHLPRRMCAEAAKPALICI